MEILSTLMLDEMLVDQQLTLDQLQMELYQSNQLDKLNPLQQGQKLDLPLGQQGKPA